MSRGLAVLLLASGCTDANPVFHLAIDSMGGGSTGPLVSTSGEPTTATTTVDPSSGRTTSDGATDTTGDLPTTGTTTDTGTTTTSVDPSDSDATTGDEVCGDGMLDPGEQCDAGAQNGAGDDCMAGCTLTVCNDQYKGASEECDLPGGNSDLGECTTECKLPVCGDGVQNGGENCDMGPQNGTGPGLCSADCKAEIPGQTLTIRLSAQAFGGKLFADQMLGVFGGDELCGDDFKMMAAAKGVRTASTGPHDGEGQQAWVLKPYRAYVNDKDIVVFVTGAEGLLGVVNGQPVDLLAPIGSGKVWTGLLPTWQTAAEGCLGWSVLNGQTGVIGEASAINGEFLSTGPQLCSMLARLYCVEQ